MTERTFTIEEIKQIFRAGVQQGEDQSSAFDWGESSKQSTDEAFKSVIEEILYERSREWPSEQDVMDFIKEAP